VWKRERERVCERERERNKAYNDAAIFFLFQTDQKASLCKRECVFVCERARAHTHARLYTGAASKPPKGVIMRMRQTERERERESARARRSTGAGAQDQNKSLCDRETVCV